MAAPNTTPDEIEPMAFINGAIDYQVAADDLCTLWDEKSQRRIGLDPVYLLYFHAIELALKGYLRAHGHTTADLRAKKRHSLTKLYEECEGLARGLELETRLSRENVISLLESGNKLQALRYFSLKSRALPELGWTREVARALVQAARAEVLKLDPNAERPGFAVKADFTIGKPRPKD